MWFISPPQSPHASSGICRNVRKSNVFVLKCQLIDQPNNLRSLLFKPKTKRANRLSVPCRNILWCLRPAVDCLRPTYYPNWWFKVIWVINQSTFSNFVAPCIRLGSLALCHFAFAHGTYVKPVLLLVKYFYFTLYFTRVSVWLVCEFFALLLINSSFLRTCLIFIRITH